MTDQFTFKYWNDNHLDALMALEIATGLAGPRGGPLWNGAWTQLTWLRSYAAEHPGITTTELARAFLRDRARLLSPEIELPGLNTRPEKAHNAA